MPNIVPRLVAPFWRCSPAFPPKRPRRQMRGLRNGLYSFPGSTLRSAECRTQRNSRQGVSRPRKNSAFPVLHRDVSFCSGRLPGVEPSIPLFDPTGPLVPGNGSADVVRASALARSGDLRLRLAVCEGKHLIIEARRATLAPSFGGRTARPRPARAAEAGFRGEVGVLAKAVLLTPEPLLYRASTRSVASSSASSPASFSR